MKAWSTAGGVLNVPGDLVGRFGVGDPEVDSFKKLCLQLIHRRLLPRRFWYYVKWGYRASRHIDSTDSAQTFSGGIHGYLDAKFGDWEIFKGVISTRGTGR